MVIAFSITSCSVNSCDINRYKSKFESNKQDFEKLVQLLKQQDIRIGYSINENELTEDTKAILRVLDINDVNLNITSCQGLIDYQFTSSWSRKATLYFSKDSCNKEQTIKGYHANLTEMVEIWGLGDGWTMWIDHDFI